MSWLARSIANSLKLDDDEYDDYRNSSNDNSTNQSKREDQNQTDPQSPSSSPNIPRGVKEDLSELSKTLSRQFWGVASFLAPPPPEQSQPSDRPDKEQPSDPDASDEAVIAGIRSDFAEIGGRFRSGISKLSNNIAVSEITKIASNFLQFGSEEEGVANYQFGNAVGVSEEVVAFARDIATHPETWLDFPLPDNDDFEDFDMSDAQQEHALAVERLSPRLASLRIELCPGYMSEDCFWKIYFVLVHPRLSKHAADILSTPDILEARAMLSHVLWKEAKQNPMTEQNELEVGPSHSNEVPELPRGESLPVPSGPSHAPSESVTPGTSTGEEAPSIDSDDFETEKHPFQSMEMPVIDKSVIEEEPVHHQGKSQPMPSSSSSILDEKFEDDGDGDDWLKEENSEIVSMGGTPIPLANDEDVSFSDLEDDDDVPVTYKKVTSGSDSSAKDSRDWVQLGRNSTGSTKDINPVGEKTTGSEQVSVHNSENKESSDWLDLDDIDEM